jgi:Na+/proline symporter
MSTYKRSDTIVSAILSMLATLFLVTTIADIPFLENLIVFILINSLVALLVIFVLVNEMRTKNGKVFDVVLGLIVILCLPIAVGMLIFPNLEEKFYFGYGVFIIFIFLTTIIFKSNENEKDNTEKPTKVYKPRIRKIKSKIDLA